jgi:hypothetical protein
VGATKNYVGQYVHVTSTWHVIRRAADELARAMSSCYNETAAKQPTLKSLWSDVMFTRSLQQKFLRQFSPVHTFTLPIRSILTFSRNIASKW